jgi:hypothetical protein
MSIPCSGGVPAAGRSPMIRFQNTLTRALEPFTPLDPNGKTV